MQMLWESVLRFLKNLRMELSRHATPGCKPERLQSPHATETLTQCSLQLFTTALRPEEWMWKMCMSTREFYLVVKINEVMMSAGKWMELEVILLSNISQIQKDEERMFSLICGP